MRFSAFTRKMAQFIEDEGLDTSVEEAWVPIDHIAPSEAVDPSVVEKLQRAMGDGWPPGLPALIVAGDDPYMLLDGHHRWLAALQRGLTKVPVLILPLETFEASQASRIDFIEAMALLNPAVKANLALSAKGTRRPKRRTIPLG